MKEFNTQVLTILTYEHRVERPLADYVAHRAEGFIEDLYLEGLLPAEVAEEVVNTPKFWDNDD